jgi:hypothetical protein
MTTPQGEEIVADPRVDVFTFFTTSVESAIWHCASYIQQGPQRFFWSAIFTCFENLKSLKSHRPKMYL